MRYPLIIWVFYLLLIIAMPCRHHTGHDAISGPQEVLEQQDAHDGVAKEKHDGTCSPFCGFQCCQASVKPEANLESFQVALFVTPEASFFPKLYPEQFPSDIFQPPRRV